MVYVAAEYRIELDFRLSSTSRSELVAVLQLFENDYATRISVRMGRVLGGEVRLTPLSDTIRAVTGVAAQITYHLAEVAEAVSVAAATTLATAAVSTFQTMMTTAMAGRVSSPSASASLIGVREAPEEDPANLNP